MRHDLVTINGSSLPVREYAGKRVVTYADIAQVHNVEQRSLRDNFKNNRKHFKENVDYFLFRGKKACRKFMLASKTITNLNVFTESGYLMLVKSLTDDLSWQVQRELVNRYFQRPANPPLARGKTIVSLFPLLQDDFKKIIYYRVEKGLTQEETAKILGMASTTLWKMEMRLRAAGIDLPPVRNNSAKFSLRNYRALAALEA
jgi:hypothetical protein